MSTPGVSPYAWAEGDELLPDMTGPQNSALRALIRNTDRLPPHAAVLQADRYPDAAYPAGGEAQQIQAVVSYSDGLGRLLQTTRRDEPGLAYQRTDDGELVTDGDTLTKADTGTAPRWAVSGKVEYDNKGNAVRVYLAETGGGLFIEIKLMVPGINKAK